MLFLITTTTVLPDRPAVSGAEAVTVMPGISRAMNTVKDRTKEAAGSDKEERKKEKKKKRILATNPSSVVAAAQVGGLRKETKYLQIKD